MSEQRERELLRKIGEGMLMGKESKPKRPVSVERIKELFKCKECEGAGWTIGLKNGLRGEPEQEQIQCPNCYQGSICLPDREDELAQKILAEINEGEGK